MVERDLLPPFVLIFLSAPELNVTCGHMSKGRGEHISTVSTYHASENNNLDRMGSQEVM